jgi:isopenicillin-N epimerase
VALQFGRHLIDRFLLDPTVTYLNHGTVGAPPRVVLEHQRALQDRIELQPAQFLLRELADYEASGKPAQPHMRVAAEAVADFVGCDPDLFGFVENATTGANAVLQSFPFEPGDEILLSNLGYGSITKIAQHVAARTGASVRIFDLPAPGSPVDDFVTATVEALRPKTRMLVIDHITAETALVLPIHRIVSECHERGIATLVDGAHAPGGIALDVESIGADFYVANLHKWLFTPRSCGFVATTPEWADRLHPTVISWGYGNGLAAEFDLLGTRDPSPALTAPMAIDAWKEWGGSAILRHNHDLVWHAALTLAGEWGTEFTTPEEMVGSMAYVSLPPELGATKADAVALQSELLSDDRIEIPVFAHGGQLRCRVSTQIYNDVTDVAILGHAVTSRR